MKYLVMAATDIGISRHSNQDSVLVQLALDGDRPLLLAAVCDGMGGLFGGEIASATAVCALKRWFMRQCATAGNGAGLEQLSDSCAAMLDTLNARMKTYELQTRKVMGTTLTCLLILEDEYAILHIGDSRAYYINNGVTCLTTDHTVVAEAVAAGRMTADEAAISKDRSKLTQCLGASKRYEPERLYGKVHRGDVFLLCTDGLRHCLSAEEMRKSFSSPALADETALHSACLECIQRVKEREEKDNISLAVVKAG